jgi:hypothetical protein
VTIPDADTAATPGALVLHMTDVFDVPDTLAESGVVCATCTDALLGEMLTPTVFGAKTVMLRVAKRRGSATDVAVMMVVPALCAVTTPAASMVATLGALDCHVTPLLVLPVTVARTVVAPPIGRIERPGTIETAITGDTTTCAVAACVGSATDVAVMVVVPAATPVTPPV